MHYSQLFGKTVKTVPADIKTVSHKLLHQGGFIRQISTGRYAFLPLGYRVWQKIYQVIQAEMDVIGCQQLVTPTLHPIEFWTKTHRDRAFGDEMLVVKDHHGARFAIGATAEGMMVELVKKFAPSHKDLPIIIYQFSNKFRDEKRPRGGLLRVREFMMKDAYSFTATEKESLEWYQRFYDAYTRLAKKFDLKATAALSSSGAIGGDYNHEFMVKSKAGESTFYECTECHFAMTDDYAAEKKIADLSICPECGKDSLAKHKAIEWGHVFKQDHFYTQPHQGYFVDQDGSQKPLWMGAYGIGVGRTLATIAETHHDKKGIVWPEVVAPYQTYLVDLINPKSEISPSFPDRRAGGQNSKQIQNSNDQNPKHAANQLYEDLQEIGLEVLYDDRQDVSAGEKFADADLIGIPYRLVISEKTLQKGAVEVKKRDSDKLELVYLDEIGPYLKEALDR